MAIKTKEEILGMIKDRFEGDTSDNTLSFIEDISDTINDLETKAKGDGKDWKAEAERIDKDWREKYRNRFFSKPVEDPPEEEDDDKPKTYRYEDLFKE